MYSFMDSKLFSPCIVVLVIMLFSIWNTHVHCQSSSFKVTDFGAIADGKTDNSKAFLEAWKKACQTNGGTLEIPKGTYLVSGAQFFGPCNGETTVLLNGILQASSIPIPNLDYWIMFYKVNNLQVYGDGTFDGNGAYYWAHKSKTSSMSSIKLEAVTNAKIQQIKSLNSKMFHIGIHNSEHVTIDNIGITAPSNSPNTDGIHIGLSNFITITNSNIATGDDCISMGDGSTNVNITGVTCGPGHGISIGSLGRYEAEKDVSSITVTNCTLLGTTNGVRIKTFATLFESMVYDVTFQHIIMDNAFNPIIIDQHYCPGSDCDRKGESSVSIKGVKFIDVRGSSKTQVGVNILCSKKKPCQDIELSGVNLKFNGQPTTASCSNVDLRLLGADQIPSKCS